MADPRDLEVSVELAGTFARWGVGTVEVHGTPMGTERLKVPVGEDWQRRATVSGDTIRQRITRQYGQYGLKVMAGSRAIGLDVDRPDLFPWRLLPEGAVIVRHGGRNGSKPDKAHVWVSLPPSYPPDAVPAKRPWGEIANVRQRQLVGPGSLHPDGTLYAVVSGELPDELPELEPQAAEGLLGMPGERHRGDDRPPPDTGDWTWSPDLGSRHELLLSRVRYWRGVGLSRRVMRQNLDDYLERHQVPLTHGGRSITGRELDDLVAWAFFEVPEDGPDSGGGTFVWRQPDPVPISLEVDGLGAQGRMGRLRLRLQMTVGSQVRVDGWDGSEPAMVRGMAQVGRVQDRMSLARHLAEAQSGSRDQREQRTREWLRLIEAVVAHVERGAASRWHHDLVTDMQPPGPPRWRLYQLSRAGEDATLVAHRGRLKTWTLLAHDLSLLTGCSLLPQLPVVETVTDVIHLNVENSPDMVRGQAVRWLRGAGLEPEAVTGRLHILAPPPALPELPEVVLELVSELKARRGEELSLHVSVDSAESLIGTASITTSGDAWGAGATALFDLFRAVRHVSGLEDISSLTLDHGGGDKPPDLDTLASHRSLGEYGSRRKTDRARAAMRCSKLEHETDDVLLVFGTYKAWPDQGRMDDTFMRYRFTEDSVRAEPSAKPVGSYPESITASDTLAAWMYDEFTEAAVPDPDTGETHELAMTVQELAERLKAEDRPNVTEAKVRNRLNEHPDAFVRVDSQLSRGRHQALWQRIPPA